MPEAILNLTLERLDDSGEEEIWHIPNWLYILLICCVIILMLRRVPQRENLYSNVECTAARDSQLRLFFYMESYYLQ